MAGTYEGPPMTASDMLHTVQKMTVRRRFDLKSPVVSMEFIQDGTQLVASTQNGHIFTVDMLKAEITRDINSSVFGCGQLKYGAHPNVIFHATTQKENTTRMLSMYDNKYIRVFTGHTDTVQNISFNPLHNQLITCGDDNRMLIFDVRVNKHVGELKHTERIIAAYDSSNLVATVVTGNVLYPYDIKMFQRGPFDQFKLPELENGQPWMDVSLSTKGRAFLTSTGAKACVVNTFDGDDINVFDVQNENGVRLRGSFSHINECQNIIMCGGRADGSIRIYGELGEHLADLRTSHEGPVTHVSYNPTCNLFATATDCIRLWQ